MTGIEGLMSSTALAGGYSCVTLTLMSSGSVTDVTGTLFRMRNTFCWTVRMNI